MIKSRNYSPLKVNIVIQVVNDAFDGNDWYEMEMKKNTCMTLIKKEKEVRI